MDRRRRIDQFLKGRVIGRLEAGQTQTEVSRALNVSQSIISRLWRRYRDTGEVSTRHRAGRPRVTNYRQDRYLAVTARRYRTLSGRLLSAELAAASGVRVSRQTVYRRLGAKGLFARRPAICVPLTRVQRRIRLRWSRDHQNWTQNDWSNVLFSDESRFSLQTDSRRTILWRERGTRYHPNNIVERDQYGGGGVMVWAGIMMNGRTQLHVFDRGNINALRYRDEILRPYVRLFRGAVGPDFLFMDDNARPHRALLVGEFLESEDINRMEWPARSPDMNPIENVWDALGRRVSSRQPPPRTIQELRTVLKQEWELLPTELIQHVITSMKRRCEACIAVRGNHIPY